MLLPSLKILKTDDEILEYFFYTADYICDEIDFIQMQETVTDFTVDEVVSAKAFYEKALEIIIDKAFLDFEDYKLHAFVVEAGCNSDVIMMGGITFLNGSAIEKVTEFVKDK